METRIVDLKEVRVAPDPVAPGRTIQGYAALFESKSVLMGDFYEVITKGAFADTIATDDIRALYNHDDSRILGRTAAGTLELWEDDIGLGFKCHLGERTYEADLAVSLERGDITGCSFGFLTEAESIDGRTPEGITVRRLDKVKLVEVSLGVTFPAYPDTTVALRSINHALQVRHNLDDRMRKNKLTIVNL